jgi:hypothetical protein
MIVRRDCGYLQTERAFLQAQAESQTQTRVSFYKETLAAYTQATQEFDEVISVLEWFFSTAFFIF